MLIDIVKRLRENFDVELIMQGVLSFTVHPSVILSTAISFFSSWDLRKAPAAEAGGYKVIRNKEHRAAAEGSGPDGEIVQLMPKVEYTWVGLARIECMYCIRCGPKRRLCLQASTL